MIRFAVVGSRTLHPIGGRPHPDAFAAVQRFIGALPDDAVIVTGGARGPDKWAEEAARARGLTVVVYHPNWEKHGTRAGMIRNADIIGNADGVLAVYDGRSSGTAHSIRLAREKGKTLRILHFIAESVAAQGEPPRTVGLAAKG